MFICAKCNKEVEKLGTARIAAVHKKEDGTFEELSSTTITSTFCSDCMIEVAREFPEGENNG